ncbi:MAG: glycosyltransferase, partial [Syntrophaceticus schinkii]|nr:glycosyltransferase [Syntrophaceticus schinkii]
PYNGIEEWFEPGKEVIVVNSEEEAVETYKRLLGDQKERETLASRARERVLREHTYRERAAQIVREMTR